MAISLAWFFENGMRHLVYFQKKSLSDEESEGKKEEGVSYKNFALKKTKSFKQLFYMTPEGVIFFKVRKIEGKRNAHTSPSYLPSCTRSCNLNQHLTLTTAGRTKDLMHRRLVVASWAVRSTSNTTCFLAYFPIFLTLYRNKTSWSWTWHNAIATPIGIHHHITAQGIKQCLT